MEIVYKKWNDPSGADKTDGYKGWGYQINIGKINIGWLPAFDIDGNEMFRMGIQHINWLDKGIEDLGLTNEYTLEDAKTKFEGWLNELDTKK